MRRDKGRYFTTVEEGGKDIEKGSERGVRGKIGKRGTKGRRKKEERGKGELWREGGEGE